MYTSVSCKENVYFVHIQMRTCLCGYMSILDACVLSLCDRSMIDPYMFV